MERPRDPPRVLTVYAELVGLKDEQAAQLVAVDAFGRRRRRAVPPTMPAITPVRSRELSHRASRLNAFSTPAAATSWLMSS